MFKSNFTSLRFLLIAGLFPAFLIAPFIVKANQLPVSKGNIALFEYTIPPSSIQIPINRNLTEPFDISSFTIGEFNSESVGKTPALNWIILLNLAFISLIGLGVSRKFRKESLLRRIAEEKVIEFRRLLRNQIEAPAKILKTENSAYGYPNDHEPFQISEIENYSVFCLFFSSFVA